MSDSYTNLLYHIVFSTKDRRPLITAEYELRLYDYIGGTIRDLGGISLALNGTEDHLHVLAKLRPDLAVSENNLGLGLALNDGNGQFGDFEIYSAGSPAGLALGDFDLKRGLDLAVVSGGEGGSTGSLSALLNSGPRH